MKVNDEVCFNLVRSRLNFLNGLVMFVHMQTVLFYYCICKQEEKCVCVCASKVIFCSFSFAWSVPDAVLGLNALVTNEVIIITWMVSSYK